MKILDINESDFKREVLESNKIVLVDFYANWCGPCKMQGKVLEQLSLDDSKYKIVKVNVDNNSSLARDWGILSIPALFIMKSGKKVFSLQGFQTKETLLEELKKI